MERESLDDDEEEEDRENLIGQNEMNSKIRRSSFDIDEANRSIARKFCFRKRYLFAICLPISLILIYFSVDLVNLFRSVSVTESEGDHMRESELRALNLLKNQQLGLLNLWNRTVVQSRSNSKSNSNNNDKFLFEDFKSELLKQIKLNKEIQKTLLDRHIVGNSLDLVDDDVDPEFDGYSINRCPKVDLTVRKRTIEWTPKPNRYLFAICLSGQMSNHLICLEKHMFFAALLNRLLVIPSPKFDYDYDQVVDIDHINSCFGRKVVISFEEFSKIKKDHLHVDRFICYITEPACYVDEEHVKRLKSLGLSMGKIEPAWPGENNLKEPTTKVVGDIMVKFSCDDQVLAIGDMFYANVEEEWVTQPGGPLMHKCKTVIQPSRLIVVTAQRFVQTFLGRNFIALHFRRHGFLKFCNAKKESCFFPIPQVAECILRVVKRANAPVIYLSTDAAESESNLLQSLILLNGKVIPLVKRPAHTSVEKWDADLYRHNLSADGQVGAMLDKTICAMSTVFIASSGSTFTDDILRLRKDWGSASVCDEYLCQGEQPNFIAEPGTDLYLN